MPIILNTSQQVLWQTVKTQVKFYTIPQGLSCLQIHNLSRHKSQELEFRSLYHLYSLKTKSSRCHYVVMTSSETKLSVAIPAPVSGQSAVNVATATSSVR